MARLRLQHVKSYHDRHGKLRIYFKRPGSRNIPLVGMPGSPEFMASYAGAVEATRPKEAVRPPPEKKDPGSIDALISEYYRSPQFRGLAPITQSTYRNEMDKIRREHGDKPAAMLDRRGILKLMGEKGDKPGAANKLLRTIRLLMRFGIEIGMRADDPTASVKKMKVPGDGFVAWGDEQIAAFERAHPIGTRERLALALLLYTAQRRKDVTTMGRQHLKGGMIAVRQSKTGTPLDIPIHPDLAAIIAATPASGMIFLTTGKGAPFTPAGFGNWFGDACRAAGLPAGYNAHGLRKAACRRLAEAGCTTLQIMAISGHRNIEEVERYTRSVEQARLGREAIARLPVYNRT